MLEAEVNCEGNQKRHDLYSSTDISSGKAKDELEERCNKYERDENKYIILDCKPEVKRPISIHRN